MPTKPQSKPSSKALTKEFARPSLTGMRSVWQDSVLDRLTPARLAGLLRQVRQSPDIYGIGEDWLTLAEQMEEADPHYRSVLTTRKQAVAALAPVVEPASESTKDAQIAEEIASASPRQRPSPTWFMNSWMLWARGLRWWRLSGRCGTVPMACAGSRCAMFGETHAFSPLTARRARPCCSLTRRAPEGIPLPLMKFVHWRPKLKSGLAVRGGFAFAAAWYFLFKAYTVRDWAAFLDVYGIPMRIGKYGLAASEENIRQLQAAIAQLSSDAAGVIPENMSIEILGSAGSAGSGSGAGAAVFGTAAEYVDAQMSKLILGQTMTTDSGGSLAQARVHEQVREDLLRADARSVGNAIMRDVVVPYLALNHGAECLPPRLRLHVPDTEDTSALMVNIEKFVALGGQVSEAEIRARLGLREPEKGEAVLGQAKPEQTKQDSAQALALAAEQAAQGVAAQGIAGRD